MITLVTGNPDKLRELQAIAASLATRLEFTAQEVDLTEIQSLDLQDIVADKLRWAYETVQQPVIVEDVAAELASLQGLPGPFIKFFEQKLGRDALYQLSKQPGDSVVIRCVAGYYDGKTMLFAEGVLSGTITAPRGDNGFGFDCVIVPDSQTGEQRTVAEMSDEDKNAISHRAKAFKLLLEQLPA